MPILIKIGQGFFGPPCIIINKCNTLSAALRKENATLQSEQHKIEPLEHELEELKLNIASLKEEKPVLQSKVRSILITLMQTIRIIPR